VLSAAAVPAGPPPSPAVAALVLDTSGSLPPPELDLARELATGVLLGLPPGSEVAVFSFDDQSRLVQERTRDADAVRRAIGALRGRGRHTALHDALYDASRYLRDAVGERRAILLMTDGRDENSSLDLEDGLKLAQETGIPVFCVGVGRVEERVLRRIAKLTGGEYLRAGEARGSDLVERILAIPVAPATAPSPQPLPAAPAAAPASAPPPSAAPLPPAAPTGRALYESPFLWASAGLLLLTAAVAVALRGRRVRAPAPPQRTPRPPAGPARPETPAKDDLPRTVLTRMDLAEEHAGRTVLLQEWPVLAVTQGARLGTVFPLSAQSATSIGRAAANDIVLDDSSASSQHCRIRPEDGRFVLHDLKSTNGTIVNGKRVERHVLAEGDVVQVGETSLQFRRERGRRAD
jgi:hypothetical protein